MRSEFAELERRARRDFGNRFNSELAGIRQLQIELADGIDAGQFSDDEIQARRKEIAELCDELEYKLDLADRDFDFS